MYLIVQETDGYEEPIIFAVCSHLAHANRIWDVLKKDDDLYYYNKVMIEVQGNVVLPKRRGKSLDMSIGTVVKRSSEE